MIAAVAAEQETIVEQLRRFVAERDWEELHTPKNLTMAFGGCVPYLL